MPTENALFKPLHGSCFLMFKLAKANHMPGPDSVWEGIIQWYGNKEAWSIGGYYCNIFLEVLLIVFLPLFACIMPFSSSNLSIDFNKSPFVHLLPQIFCLLAPLWSDKPGPAV